MVSSCPLGALLICCSTVGLASAGSGWVIREEDVYLVLRDQVSSGDNRVAFFPRLSKYFAPVPAAPLVPSTSKTLLRLSMWAIREEDGALTIRNFRNPSPPGDPDWHDDDYKYVFYPNTRLDYNCAGQVRGLAQHVGVVKLYEGLRWVIQEENGVLVFRDIAPGTNDKRIAFFPGCGFSVSDIIGFDVPSGFGNNLPYCSTMGGMQLQWNDAYSRSADRPGRSELSMNWMRCLEDSKLIRNVSMPGTHDSTTYNNRAYGDPVSVQSMSVSQQLEAGIRYLDYRTCNRELANVYETDSLRMYHGSFDLGLTMGQALDQVISFLFAHQSETVLIRIRRECEGAFQGSQSKWEKLLLGTLNAYSQFWYRPGNPADNPTLGALRGKFLVLVSTGRLSSEVVGLDIDVMKAAGQDESSLDSNWSLYDKWRQVKASLVAAADNRDKGPINHLSASVGSFPYFVVSGQSSPEDGGPFLLTGCTKGPLGCACFLSDNCWEDFPRKSCCSGTCSIAFGGTNLLATSWISTRPSTDYVGIIATDFPGASFIHTVFAVNFPRSLRPNVVGIGGDSSCSASCIAGDTKVVVLQPSGGTEERQASAIRVGDLIRGAAIAELPATRWCSVISAQYHGTGSVAGDFTSDHYVVASTNDRIVRRNDSAALRGDAPLVARDGVELYNIATDCEVASTTDGVLFTPLSSVFCGTVELSVSQYVAMYAAILRVARKTGMFWFAPSTFTKISGNDSTAWQRGLPQICSQMLLCMNSAECDGFETAIAVFVDTHMVQGPLEVVSKAYPGLGDSKHAYSLSSDVRGNTKHFALWISVGAGVSFVALVATVAAVVRRWKAAQATRQGVMEAIKRPATGAETTAGGTEVDLTLPADESQSAGSIPARPKRLLSLQLEEEPEISLNGLRNRKRTPVPSAVPSFSTTADAEV